MAASSSVRSTTYKNPKCVVVAFGTLENPRRATTNVEDAMELVAGSVGIATRIGQARLVPLVSSIELLAELALATALFGGYLMGEGRASP